MNSRWEIVENLLKRPPKRSLIHPKKTPRKKKSSNLSLRSYKTFFRKDPMLEQMLFISCRSKKMWEKRIL
jgi:hypothetical protein